MGILPVAVLAFFALLTITAAVLHMYSRVKWGSQREEREALFAIIERATTISKKRIGFTLLGVVLFFSLVLFVLTLRIMLPAWFAYGVIALAVMLLLGAMVVLVVTKFKTESRGSVIVFLATLTLFGVLVALYLNWTNWLTVNLLASLLGYVALVAWSGFFSFRVAALLGAAMFIYDVIGVFVTGHMLKAADRISGEGGSVLLPVFLFGPREFDLGKPAVMLGLGDVVIPGVLIVAAAAFTAKHGKGRIICAGMLGYVAGLLLAMLAANTWGAQPALLYLYPCVLGALVGAAHFSGVLRQLIAPRRKASLEGADTK